MRNRINHITERELSSTGAGYGLVDRLICRVSVGGGGASSTSHTTTATTSGANSPVAAEGSQSIGTGSIGVAGTNARYVETGATDNSNANQSTNISTGYGSNVTIGDPNADTLISQLANTFSSTVQNVAGTSAQTAQAAAANPLSNIPWGTLGIVAGVLLLVMILSGRKS